MKRKYSIKLVLISLLLLSLLSCTQIVPLDNYKGDVVYEKHISDFRDYHRIIIKSNDTLSNRHYFRNITVMKFDYEKYNVGDTIK